MAMACFHSFMDVKMRGNVSFVVKTKKRTLLFIALFTLVIMFFLP